MDKFEFICRYCNYFFDRIYMPKGKINCPKCNDTNIKISKATDKKIDYYAGSPPFKDLELEWNF